MERSGCNPCSGLNAIHDADVHITIHHRNLTWYPVHRVMCCKVKTQAKKTKGNAGQNNSRNMPLQLMAFVT